MNLKTTVLLLVLLVAGAAGWWFWEARQPHRAASESLVVLEDELTPDKLTRIEIIRGERHVSLERKPGQEWSLPGHWPVRTPEVEELVRIVTNLRTRFVPISLDSPPDLKGYGLDPDPLSLKVQTAGKEHVLVLGEEPGQSNRFSRPTYVRVDQQPEVVRLSPGIVQSLDRPQEYYMHRRLFPAERLAKEGEPAEKIEQLAAKEISFKAAKDNYVLVRTDSDWELRQPFRDKADPDKLQKIVTAIPDIWAEQFIDKKEKKAEDTGLKTPTEKLDVVLANGAKVTLLIGKESQVKQRLIKKPAPPFGPPQAPQMDLVREEYRYAKLADNDQVFEIRADRLKDLDVPAPTLRDPRLARFRTDDVRRLEIKQDSKDIVIAKDKDKNEWKLQKPKAVDAETSKVTELLDKLSGLEARDADVVEKGDAKTYGLEKPAVVTVDVEETKGTGDKKTTKKHTYTFRLGKHDKDKKKLYVQVAGWPRINAVDDSVEKLIERPALAYRSRRVLDYAMSDLSRIEVKRPGETFSLEQVKDTWRLATPVHADVDGTKADNLARDVGRLEVVDFITDQPKTEDVDKVYGLAKPDLSVKLVPSDTKKPPQTLLIGKERKDKKDEKESKDKDSKDKREYYARLESDPAVFVIKKDVHDEVDRDSLAYRSQQLWKLPGDEIAELRIEKEESGYRLKRDGSTWKISGPFDADAVRSMVQPITDALGDLRCEKFVAHKAKDLGNYGLDKPYLRVGVVPEKKTKDGKDQKEAKEVKEAGKEHVLRIGKTVEKDKGRYAQLGDSEAIFVLSDKTVSALDHRSLDFLNRDLFSTNTDTIQRVTKKDGSGWALQKEKDKWWLVDSPVTPFLADEQQVAGTLGSLANLRAKEFAAYGPKAGFAAFGLEKPETTITFTVQPSGDKDKAAKAVTHNLTLGGPVKGAAEERYARFDQGPGVAVLDATTVKELARTYLGFVNHQVLKLDPNQVNGIARQMGGGLLEIARKTGNWKLVKPAEAAADQPTVDRLVTELAGLRAVRVAAFPVKDAKDLAAYGLDPPAAVINIRVNGTDGKASEQRLQIGKPATDGGKPGGERYARADNGTAVVVLPGSISKQLLAPVLQFRDRDLAKIEAIDRLTLDRGPRKAVFAKMDDIWKMIEPVQADAEQGELDTFAKSLSRLRADDLVADRPADLKAFGLDRPEVQWRAGAGGKDMLTLQVGAPEKSADGKGIGPRRYARLANSDLVFLLSADVSSQALAEYRNRKALSSLDTAQVDKIRFGYESSPFVLAKADNKWQLEGKPKTKIKEDAVRDMLGALAKFRVERYLVDKGADLKLFGLQPPVLSLELSTPSGKQVLLIGNTEGTSRRHYATVPGMNAEVFIISEADAAQIVRPLQAFLDKGG